MDILLKITTILAYITPWALPLSLVMLVTSIVVDVFKKKFYWSKFALFFVATSIILVIIQISLIYKLTKSIISSPSQQNTSTVDQIVKNQYANTTLGYSIMLPEGWSACESGNAGGRMRIAKSQKCGISWDESFILDTALNRPLGLLERKQRESFIDWVKRSSKENTSYLKSPDKVESEFTTISPQVIVEKQTYSTPNTGEDKISYGKNIYIEDFQTTAFILRTEGPYGMNRDKSLDKDIVLKFPLEQFIPLIKNAPITTGDITGSVGKKVKGGSSIYPNYQGTFYQDDKKTVATTFTTDRNGVYLVRLKPGTYYFIYPDKKEEKITVILGKETRFKPDIKE